MNFFCKLIPLFAFKKNAFTFASAFEKQKHIEDDSVAQQVEHIPFKDGVLGSNPSWVTKFKIKALQIIDL